MTRILFALPLAGLMMTSPLAFAQTTAPAPAAQQPAAQPAPPVPDQAANGGCVDITTSVSADTPAAAGGGNATARAPSESETQPVVGPDAGTAPGGSGSSGWTGGLGGSDIGTTQSKEQATAPQQPDHPKVASGLDPISGETKVTGPQAPAATIDKDAAAKPATSAKC